MFPRNGGICTKCSLGACSPWQNARRQRSKPQLHLFWRDPWEASQCLHRIYAAQLDLLWLARSRILATYSQVCVHQNQIEEYPHALLVPPLWFVRRWSWSLSRLAILDPAAWDDSVETAGCSARGAAAWVDSVVVSSTAIELASTVWADSVGVAVCTDGRCADSRFDVRAVVDVLTGEEFSVILLLEVLLWPAGVKAFNPLLCISFSVNPREWGFRGELLFFWFCNRY